MKKSWPQKNIQKLKANYKMAKMQQCWFLLVRWMSLERLIQAISWTQKSLLAILIRYARIA